MCRIVTRRGAWWPAARGKLTAETWYFWTCSGGGHSECNSGQQIFDKWNNEMRKLFLGYWRTRRRGWDVTWPRRECDFPQSHARWEADGAMMNDSLDAESGLLWKLLDLKWWGMKFDFLFHYIRRNMNNLVSKGPSINNVDIFFKFSDFPIFIQNYKLIVFQELRQQLKKYSMIVNSFYKKYMKNAEFPTIWSK